jgi:Zn finger protein HypA/HybF involved in hydrogenase expression
MKFSRKQIRPSYDKVDKEDRHAQLSSRTDILSKSFTTDLWMKVITRAIDDVALYRFMRIEGKELKEEELEFEHSASSFLFDKDYLIPIDDYEVDVECQKCDDIWISTMSDIAGTDVICPLCGHKTGWKFTQYTVTENQQVKEISLKELIALWGVEDIDGFRNGCRRRIKEIVKKKITAAQRAVNKKQV